MLAFGDSITHGGGELQWGVALQSWALWVARGLGLPFTSFAVDGARAADVVAGQIPAFGERSAHPEARYEVGCLYIGVNDVRAPDWDPTAFETDFRIALGFLAQRCDRVLAVTAPLGLGLPRAGPRVIALDEIVQAATHELGGLLVDLRSLAARNLVMADRVHPTAFGQLWIAQRAVAVLAQDGLATRVAPASLISFQTTRWGRLRGDMTYAYRSAKLHARALVLGTAGADVRQSAPASRVALYDER